MNLLVLKWLTCAGSASGANTVIAAFGGNDTKADTA
jgi:hypothetical protein